MSYWRKLFIVMLLALSLPVQSFAAIAMDCAAAQAYTHDAHSRHVETGEAEHDANLNHAALAGDPMHHHAGDTSNAHSCAACASCCLGTGLPAASLIGHSAGVPHAAISFAPSAGVASFLTDGVERPPRAFLV